MKSRRFASRAAVAVVVVLCAPAGGLPSAPAAAFAEEAAAPGRSLGIASVPNLRDLGGYRTADGGTVARGLVYRSDQLSGIGQDDMRRLTLLGLKESIDLRTSAERSARPDELPPGTRRVWLDVLADLPAAGPAQLEGMMQAPKTASAQLGGGRVEAMFADSYRKFVTLPSARREFGAFFRILADESRLPVVFHCTTGKDRTGWAAAVLLTLLGVPRETVYEDYLRSNDYILPAYGPVIDRFVTAGGEASIPLAIFGVRRDYLDAAFDEMEKQYGPVEAYLTTGLGIDSATQRKIRALYLRTN